MTDVQQQIEPFPASVNTRLGALHFELGCPTPETTRKLFDEMDFQRAVQAYLWAYPAVSFESIRITAEESLGMRYNDLGIADKFVDPRSVWLTANDTTIYAFVNIDVADGPVAVEIPPGAIVGLLDDFWQSWQSDVGLPGPDAGAGGTFLLLPPGYEGEVPSSGYHVVQATMNNLNLLVRGILIDGDIPDAVARVRQVKVYPWSERAAPTPNRFISISGGEYDTTPPAGIEFWARLAGVINHNPVQAHDRFFMAMLKPLGIEKGKAFQPDARQTALLEEAAALGDLMARNVMYENTQRISGATSFEGTNWEWVILVKPTHETEHYTQLDERLQYTFGAIYLSPAIGRLAPGPGATYVQTFRDRAGDHFDGGRSYRLHVPPNPPAAAFWSVTLYDTATRSMVQNTINDAAHSGYDDFETNDDGSLDLTFGPEAPTGPVTNWIQTVPGRGFYVMFRCYTPTAPLFDGTWTLPDIERA